MTKDLKKDGKKKKDDAAAAVPEEDKKKTVRRSKKKVVPEGRVYLDAGFNNTIVTITDLDGKTIAWHSAGAAGFKGSKKSTPYAAQMAAEGAAEKARAFGLEKADIYVKGVGHGREQALRGLISQGISIQNIYDITPLPHNGCRKPRVRRV
jgi:small subunit ribosomal protein S11